MLPSPGLVGVWPARRGAHPCPQPAAAAVSLRPLGQTFSATKEAALYRTHKPPEAVEQVVTLLAHGCPVQAIVAAFGWHERTVALYEAEAGVQCDRVHEYVIHAGGVEMWQVLGDEHRLRVGVE